MDLIVSNNETGDEIDGEKVGCYGGSYGGFTTMMLESFDRWLRDRPAAWEARWQQ